VANQSRVPPADPSGSAGLTQVLTRESCRNEIGVSDAPNGSHVIRQRNPSEVRLQYAGGAWIDLTEEGGNVTGLMEPKFYSANPSKQTRYRKRLPSGLRLS
jgi:hypothetical protein